jgi:mannose-6-phosphate isomerase-like protein (cupin superfamily)
MNRAVRRVVTGHDATGKAIVLQDGEPPVVIRSPLQPGLAFHEIWNTTEAPQTVTAAFDEPTTKHAGTAPPAGGTVIRIVDLPPEGPEGPKFDSAEARELFSAVGLEENARHHKPRRHPLMHRTRSIDYAIVLSGDVVLVLDDSEVHLKTGDVVIQRGTVHAWTNRTDKICRMAFILTDGRFDDGLAAKLAEHDARVAAQ